MNDEQLKACRAALLPCPFCGGQPKYITTQGEHGFYCHNQACSCKPETEPYMSKETAIKAWNTRAESRPAVQGDGDLRDAAMGILMGSSPHGNNQTVIETWRIKHLANTLQADKHPMKEGRDE